MLLNEKQVLDILLNAGDIAAGFARTGAGQKEIHDLMKDSFREMLTLAEKWEAGSAIRARLEEMRKTPAPEYFPQQ